MHKTVAKFEDEPGEETKKQGKALDRVSILNIHSNKKAKPIQLPVSLLFSQISSKLPLDTKNKCRTVFRRRGGNTHAESTSLRNYMRLSKGKPICRF